MHIYLNEASFTKASGLKYRSKTADNQESVLSKYSSNWREKINNSVKNRKSNGIFTF